MQKVLCEILPPFWFSSAERSGVNAMLLSCGTEKAIQRRIFVSVGGAVEISVHCKPLSDSFVSDIVKKAGTPAQLSVTNIKGFGDWVLRVVQVLRDYQVCLGVERADLKDHFLQCDNAYVDDNPYQEGRYFKTLRSKTCLRLVDPGKRRCAECCKMFSLNKKKEKSVTLPAQDCQLKKVGSAHTSESGEIISDGQSGLTSESSHTSSEPLHEPSGKQDCPQSMETKSPKKRKKNGREKQRKRKGCKETDPDFAG